MSDNVLKSAILDATGTYRYRLGRDWGASDKPGVLFVMLNPSTADAAKDDPTIRRCIGFAKSWAFDSLEVVNLYALRSTNPLGLLESADPVGPENDRHIREAAMAASVVILAHGTSSNARLRERIRSRAWTVRAILRECGRDPRCLGVTADHQPKHPVRLPGNLTPQAWRFA